MSDKELRAEIARLQTLVEGMAARIAAQSAALERMAEGRAAAEAQIRALPDRPTVTERANLVVVNIGKLWLKRDARERAEAMIREAADEALERAALKAAEIFNEERLWEGRGGGDAILAAAIRALKSPSGTAPRA